MRKLEVSLKDEAPPLGAPNVDGFEINPPLKGDGTGTFADGLPKKDAPKPEGADIEPAAPNDEEDGALPADPKGADTEPNGEAALNVELADPPKALEEEPKGMFPAGPDIALKAVLWSDVGSVDMPPSPVPCENLYESPNRQYPWAKNLQGGLVELPPARLSEKDPSWVLFFSPPPKVTLSKVDGFENSPKLAGDTLGASALGLQIRDVPKPEGANNVPSAIMVEGAGALIAADPKGDEVASPDPNGLLGVDSELDAPNWFDAVG